MQIPKESHLKYPWRVHTLLADLRIEDSWKLPVELEANQTIGEFYTAFQQSMKLTATSGLAGWLFQFRLFLGKVFGWDDDQTADSPPVGSIRKRYTTEEGLSEVKLQRERSEGFTTVYEFEEEILAEIENATVLAAVHFGRIPKVNGKFTAHMTIYVKPKGLFGELYMLLIKPFRLLIVYPVMLRLIGQQWEKIQQRKISEVLPVH